MIKLDTSCGRLSNQKSIIEYERESESRVLFSEWQFVFVLGQRRSTVDCSLYNPEASPLIGAGGKRDERRNRSWSSFPPFSFFLFSSFSSVDISSFSLPFPLSFSLISLFTPRLKESISVTRIQRLSLSLLLFLLFAVTSRFNALDGSALGYHLILNRVNQYGSILLKRAIRPQVLSKREPCCTWRWFS